MNKKKEFKKIMESAILILKPFGEEDNKMEKVFFYLSEVAGDLKLDEYRSVCLELSLYCKGSETGKFAYKNKEEILENIK